MSIDYSNEAQYEYNKKVAEFIEKGRVPTLLEEAILFAQAVQLQVLISPSSAVFPPLHQFSVKLENGVYTVTGFVDSQNTHGAMLRTTFTLNVEKHGNIWSCQNRFTSNFEKFDISSKSFIDIIKELIKEWFKFEVSTTIIYWVIGIIVTILLSTIFGTWFWFI